MAFLKRMMALVLTLVMVFSMIPVQAFAEETEPEDEVDTGDVTIEGTNGFDELPDDPLIKEHEDVAKKESAGNNGVAGSAAVVDSGTCGDNLTWTLSDEGILTISGTGEMMNLTSTTVVDGDGNAEMDANVTVGTYSDTTDKNGIAELYLPVAEYEVTVTHRGITRQHSLYVDAARKLRWISVAAMQRRLLVACWAQ